MRVRKSTGRRLKKKTRGFRGGGIGSRAAGGQTREEILSQPATWIETARRFENDAALSEALLSFSPHEPWLFIACGSSYYLSQIIAAHWTKMLRTVCTAAPASELLFAPDEVLRRSGARQVVLVSRSGKTTEVLRAAELLKAKPGIRTVGVTCNPSSALKEMCTRAITLPWADETSLVMTRSFTSILLLFQRVAARFAGDAALSSALDALPEKTTHWLRDNADKIRALGTGRAFADFVFLGQGTHYWLAQEAALKMTEMSSSYAQAYHTLEFRHGPRAIASKATLVTFLISDAAAHEECPMVDELKKLGAATLVITNRETPLLRRESDLLIQLGVDGPEDARLALAAIPAQILGLAVGLRKGLNPDEPANLSRAVVLDAGNEAPAKRRSA